MELKNKIEKLECGKNKTGPYTYDLRHRLKHTAVLVTITKAHFTTLIYSFTYEVRTALNAFVNCIALQ